MTTKVHRKKISFELNKDDLILMGQAVAKLDVKAIVDTSQPGAFVIRNHAFSTDNPGAFAIRNFSFNTEKPGAFTIRNFAFSEGK
jgi:hypothetical protein